MANKQRCNGDTLKVNKLLLTFVQRYLLMTGPLQFYLAMSFFSLFLLSLTSLCQKCTKIAKETSNQYSSNSTCLHFVFVLEKKHV